MLAEKEVIDVLTACERIKLSTVQIYAIVRSVLATVRIEIGASTGCWLMVCSDNRGKDGNFNIRQLARRTAFTVYKLFDKTRCVDLEQNDSCLAKQAV